jgi:hypothetical protein
MQFNMKSCNFWDIMPHRLLKARNQRNRYLISYGFLLDLFFYLEDRVSIALRNIG